MWWVARENWSWLVLAALLGAAVTTWLSTRRVAPAEPLHPRESTQERAAPGAAPPAPGAVVRAPAEARPPPVE